MHAWRSVSIGISGFRCTRGTAWRAAHISWSELYCAFSLDCIPSDAGQECVHCTQNLLILRSPPLSFTFGPLSLCWHGSVQTMCVFLACKRRAGDTISFKTLGQRSPGLPDFLCSPCERMKICIVCIRYSLQLPASPVQLMRTGIGQNARYAVGDFA